MQNDIVFKSFCRQQQWRMQGWCLRCTLTALWSPWWVQGSVIRWDVAKNGSLVPTHFCVFCATLNGDQGISIPYPPKVHKSWIPSPKAPAKWVYQQAITTSGNYLVTVQHPSSVSGSGTGQQRLPCIQLRRLLWPWSSCYHCNVWHTLSLSCTLSMDLLQNMDIYDIIFLSDLTLAPIIHMW